MNSVALVGRLTKDPELKKTQSGLSVCSFTLAVDRRVSKDAQNQQTADFINCVAWRQSADFLSSYGKKGSVISVEGRIQTRNYDGQDGHRVYVTEVLADSVAVYNTAPRQTSSEPRNMATGSLTRDEISKNINEGNMFDTGPDLGISDDDLPF